MMMTPLMSELCRWHAMQQYCILRAFTMHGRLQQYSLYVSRIRICDEVTPKIQTFSIVIPVRQQPRISASKP